MVRFVTYRIVEQIYNLNKHELKYKSNLIFTINIEYWYLPSVDGTYRSISKNFDILIYRFVHSPTLRVFATVTRLARCAVPFLSSCISFPRDRLKRDVLVTNGMLWQGNGREIFFTDKRISCENISSVIMLSSRFAA